MLTRLRERAVSDECAAAGRGECPTYASFTCFRLGIDRRQGPPSAPTQRKQETARVYPCHLQDDDLLASVAGMYSGAESRQTSMGTPVKSARQKFCDEVRVPTGRIDLATAALRIAEEEYPQLPVDHYLGMLDLLAVEVGDRLNGETAPLVVLDELLEHLFERRGLRGNRESYYDPRNSFLNDVLERGLGIPLTLGIVLIEVGKRLDLPLTGVNFPGHFLVRYQGEEVRLLIDPFNGGERVFEDEAQTFLDRTYGGLVRMKPHFLRPATSADMLVRMLTNLKCIYARVQDHRRTLAAIERLGELRPARPRDVRDRGILLAKLGNWPDAIGELESYLEVGPEGPDHATIRELVERLRRKTPPSPA
jgi:regulator of sirC expression with transglutaminase-like and TPR domain